MGPPLLLQHAERFIRTGSVYLEADGWIPVKGDEKIIVMIVVVVAWDLTTFYSYCSVLSSNNFK